MIWIIVICKIAMIAPEVIWVVRWNKSTFYLISTRSTEAPAKCPFQNTRHGTLIGC